MEPIMHKRDKHSIEIKSNFFREFEELVELCPQYSLAQIMHTILYWRSGKKDPTFFSNEQILKRMELIRQNIEDDFATEDYE